MGLKDTFKTIHRVAEQYIIDKPYAVGGLPRDMFMSIPNIKTTDIDITTNSAEVLRLGLMVADELNVTFDLSDDGHITVFSDEYDLDFSSHFISDAVVDYLDGKFKGLEEAFSRDFTINTLHLDLVSGKILDPTQQGFKDVKDKVIRTPVPAEITLTDDPRRAYRAINLAARYNFDVSDDIKKFVIGNPDVFAAGNIKDKYASIKINKALKNNPRLTLKLLKEMGLFKNIPLAGYFKDVLIENKMLAEYLENSALDQNFKFAAVSKAQLDNRDFFQGLFPNKDLNKLYSVADQYLVKFRNSPEFQNNLDGINNLDQVIQLLRQEESLTPKQKKIKESQNKTEPEFPW